MIALRIPHTPGTVAPLNMDHEQTSKMKAVDCEQQDGRFKAYHKLKGRALNTGESESTHSTTGGIKTIDRVVG